MQVAIRGAPGCTSFGCTYHFWLYHSVSGCLGNIFLSFSVFLQVRFTEHLLYTVFHILSSSYTISYSTDSPLTCTSCCTLHHCYLQCYQIISNTFARTPSSYSSLLFFSTSLHTFYLPHYIFPVVLTYLQVRTK